MSPLRNAIVQNDIDRVKEILAASPSSIREASAGQPPVSLFAAEHGSFEILKYIVEYSFASLDEYDSLHRNILYYATLSGDIQKCRYLTERCGMSPLEADQHLITPYEISYQQFPDTLYPCFLSLVGTPYPDMYHNPIRRGFFPDPSIVRVGEDYYMVNSSFTYFPCIPISHSRDLVHWRIIGHAITDPAWSDLGTLESGRGYWAPDISYDNGRFYITATYRHNDTDTVYRRQMVVSSEHPEGPYSKPVFIDEDGIDPSIFHENGRHYMLLNRGARIFELNEDCTRRISDASLLYYGSDRHAPEGPHLLKKDGYYYLFQAEGGTGPGHMVTVSRSRTLMGIYEPCPYNPILRQSDPQAGLQRCGHGKPVETQDGRWYMVYLCGRYLCGRYTVLGRETALDQITWTADGWPIVNSLQGPSVIAPNPFPIFREEKTEETPFRMIEWMTPREPQEGAVSVTENGIRLLSSPSPLSTVSSRNLFLHRQESFRFSAVIRLMFLALEPGDQAGLICYYDENTYVFFAVSCKGTQYACSLCEHIGDETITHPEHRLDHPLTTYVFQMETDGLKRSFSLLTDTGDILCSTTLENVYYLSDEGIEKGKRFTGATFGTAAYGKKQFTYYLQSASIHNQD